jgi:hypothetical protein
MGQGQIPLRGIETEREAGWTPRGVHPTPTGGSSSKRIVFEELNDGSFQRKAFSIVSGARPNGTVEAAR